MSVSIRLKHPLVSFLFLGIVAQSVVADDWPQWRGTAFNGASTESSAPESVDPSKDVLWAAELPGESNASPVVVGNKVFLVSNDAELSKLYGICIDRDSGKVLWQKLLAEAHGPIPRNTLAACSPVADAERVYFTFGSGPVFALDHDGNEIWTRDIKDLGRIGLQFGYSSSPTLYKGNLYYPILTGQWRSEITLREYHDGDSFLLALDAKTGDIVFHHHRDSDAVGESHDSYTTVVPYEVGEEPVIVVQGGDYTTGHDIATGEERWRFADNPRKRTNWRLIPSPIVIGDLIFNAQPRGSMAYAFDPGVKAQKDIETAAWVYNNRTTDVPTPVFYDGKLYVLNGVQKTLTCFEPKTGKELWVGDLPDNKRFWSSPVAADGKIYMIDEDGGVVVASIGSKFEILSRGAYGGKNSKASPAISDGKLFIRTSDKLYCIGS